MRHDADHRDLVTVERARLDDLPAVFDLLKESGLPLEGAADHLETMLVARQGSRVVGVAALELYPGAALLRSVAVDPRLRHQGLGHRLTDAALRAAETQRVDEVFLLTTTAEGFFPRFGFEAIARDVVPSAVRASVEFTSACPLSAVVMRKRLVHAG